MNRNNQQGQGGQPQQPGPQDQQGGHGGQQKPGQQHQDPDGKAAVSRGPISSSRVLDARAGCTAAKADSTSAKTR